MARAAGITLAGLIAVALAALVATSWVSLGLVVFLYEGKATLRPVKYLYFAAPPQPPAFCGDAPRYSDYYNASFSASGPALTLQKETHSGSAYYLLSWPALIYNVTKPGVIGLYLPGGTLLAAGSVSPPPHGYLYAYYYSLSSPVASAASYSGQVNFTTTSLYPGVWFIYGWQVSVAPPTNVKVLSFVDGQSYQVSPLVYQGDYDSTPTSLWPYDLGGSSAEAYYWDNWFTRAAAQPVMEVEPGYGVPEAGVAFWKYSYKAGSNLTLVAVLTYANSSTGLVGHGIVFYLFVKPYGWSVSPAYNFSVTYVTSENVSQPPSPVMGDVIFPNSSADYLVVQFDPAWAYNYSSLTGSSVPGSTGPWSAWVVNETKVGAGKGRAAYYKIDFAPSPSPDLNGSWSGWDGVGSWPYPWVPDAGDYVLVCVRYDPSNGYLYGFAQDLNDPFEVAYLRLSLGGYFAAPRAGTYALGVGAGTGYFYAADWGLVLVNAS